MNEYDDLHYAGFWVRLGANLLDTVILIALSLPVLLLAYGKAYLEPEPLIHGPLDIFVNFILPPILVIAFWYYKAATPGKIAVSARIVDAETGERASLGQLIGRYFAYLLSAVPLGLGFLWIAFDRRKQGWHDKLSGTVVVRSTAGRTEAVRFSMAR